MADSRNSPSTVGIRSIQERIRAMNETLDSVDQRHKQEAQLGDLKQLDPNGSSSGPVSSAAPLTSSPPVVKRSSVVDLWRMRESKNSNEAGVAVASVSKKKAAISEETFRSLLKSSNDIGSVDPVVKVGGSSPLISRKFAERSEEKKEDDDCVIGNAAASTSISVTRSPPRIVPSSSSPKFPVVTRSISHASQSTAPVSDLTILPATSSASISSSVDPEKRTSKIASIWEKMSTSYDDSSTLPAVVSKDIAHQPLDEEKCPIKSSADTMSSNVKESPLPPKRHSVVDIWNNRNSGKPVDSVAAKPPPKPLPSANSPQRKPAVPSISAVPDQVSASPPKECPSDADAITDMSHEAKSEDILKNDVSSEAAHGQRELVHDQYLNRNGNDLDHLASNTSDLKEPCNNIFEPRRSIVDRYMFHATSVSSSSVVKTVSPVVSSIVKEHSSRIPIGTFKYNKGGLGSDVQMHPVLPQNEKNSSEMTSSLSAAQTAIESAVTSVVDKHIEQHGNKVSDRWTLKKVPSPKSDKFSADTLDLPMAHGKVTDRWKPHSSSVSESGNKFDKATVAGLLKMHSANTPFGRGRHGNDRSDEPKVMQELSPSMKGESDCPINCALSSSNIKQEPAELAPDQVSTSKDLSVLSSSRIEDASTTPPVNELRACSVFDIPLEAEKPPAPLNKVNVADRWKKRLDEAKECSLEQESNWEHGGYEHVSLKTNVSSRSTLLVENTPTSGEYDSTKRNGLVSIQEKTLVEEIDPKLPELPVKPSLSVLDYAAKLRSARVPPSFLPREKKDLDLVSSKEIEKQLPTEHRDESVSQDRLASVIRSVEDRSQNDFSRPKHSKVSVNLPNQSLEENLETVTSWGVQEDYVEKSRNSSAFAPWQNVSEMSTEDDFFKNRFEPRGRKDVVNQKPSQKVETPKVTIPKNRETSHQIGRPTEVFGSTISTLYSPETRHSVEKVLPKDDSSRPPISLSTKKLASDRALNKKRLQQYRGKAKKATIAKISSSEGLSHECASLRDVSLEEKIDNVISVTNVQSSQDKSPFDYDGLLRSSGSTAERFCKPDVDDEVFAAICSTSSTTSSSPLASKAEKMLQDRRKRSNGHHRQLVEDPSNSNIHPSSMFSCYDINEPDDIGAACATRFPEDVTEDGQPRLFTRYNTSSRFIDVETSESAPAEVVYDSETVDSSFNETETTGSNSGYYGVDRQLVEEKKEAPKRRKVPVKDPPGQMSDEKSVNLSSQSAWDSDWGGSISMVSLDFNKLVSAVDEQVAAFRDFVGVSSKKPLKRSKKKSHFKAPPSAKAPPEVEDVAIEVEYVEDSFDDDDPRVDLGFCTAPIDDVVRNSLDFSNGSKSSISRNFTEPCSGMLPTGEPSYERKPTGPKHSHRNGDISISGALDVDIEGSMRMTIDEDESKDDLGFCSSVNYVT